MKNNPSKSPKLSPSSLAAIAAAVCFSINILSSNILAQEKIILPKGSAGVQIDRGSLGGAAGKDRYQVDKAPLRGGELSPKIQGEYQVDKAPNLRSLDGKSNYTSPADNPNSILGPKSPGPSGAARGIMKADGTIVGGPAEGQSFGSGFDAREPAWTKWKPEEINSRDLAAIAVPEEDYLLPLSKRPDIPFAPVDKYQVLPQDDSRIIAYKMDDLLSSVNPALRDLETEGDVVDEDITAEMMSSADAMSSTVDAMYTDIDSMYAEVDTMNAQLDQNYTAFDSSDQTPSDIQNFNAQSDAMADRVSGMRSALKGMTQRIETDAGVLEGMLDVLETMGQDTEAAVVYSDKLGKHITDVSARFDSMGKDLIKKGLGGKESVDQAKKYLSGLQKYVKDNKPYTEGQSDYLQDVKKYLKDTLKYLQDVIKDFAKTEESLKESELYFFHAKVGGEDGGADISGEVPEGEAPGPCAAAESDKPLDTLQECAKDCRTVCRWKENVGGVGCYECPSGSPDTCYDVKAWPAEHPWCQPGGICHDDPMLYCVPFGTIGPNLEKLSCTNCKARPDECWKHFGEGMTLTNCKKGCWDGKCEYIGKYQEAEWTGKPEFIHCYKCVPPPGPPSCEDMGWGTTWISDCEKGCPDGVCEQVTTTVPAKPAPPPPPPPPPGGEPQPPGQPGGDQGGGKKPEEGDTGTRGGGQGSDEGGGTDGNKPNPPGGSPEQPTGGGGGAAPTDGPATPEGQPGGEQPKPEPTPRETPPTGERSNPPQPPDQGKKPNPPPAPPPPPPDTQQMSFYKEYLAELERRRQMLQEIADNPKEGDEVRESARSYLAELEAERARTQKQLDDETAREADRLAQEEANRQRSAQYQETMARNRRDYAAESEAAGRKWKLDRLKEATDQLKAHLEEMKNVFEGRRSRLQRIDDEIAQLERENKAMKEQEAQGRMSENSTRTRTTANNARLEQLKKNRNELARKFQEAQREMNAELERLRSEYQRTHWQVDEAARRRAETQRIDEYAGLNDELRDRRASREIRNQTFNQMAQNLENEIKAREARGEDADDLKEQLENLKRGQEEWNTSMRNQEGNLEEQMYQLERRNFHEGAGPSSVEDLANSLGRYAGYMEQDLASAEKALNDLQGQDSMTEADGKRLQELETQIATLKSGIEGAKARQNELKNPNTTLDSEHAQRVHDSATRVASSAMSHGADPSFLALAAESIAEEAVHNLNPLVMAKKSLYFGYGVGEGVVSAVGGLVDIVVQVDDTIGEAVMVGLGFEDGGIFGTENLDTINALVSGVSNNLNFDGVIKAVVMAGGAIDAEIKKLEKSGDIDAATARLGGRVAGEVVGEVITDKGMGAVLGTLTHVDDAVDAGAAAGKIDNAVDAGRTAGRGPGPGAIPDGKVPDVVIHDVPGAPPGAGKIDDLADAGRGASRGAAPIPDSPSTAGTRPGSGTPDAPSQPRQPSTPDSGGTRSRTDAPGQPDAPTTPDGKKPTNVPDGTPPRTPDGTPGAGLAGKVDNAPTGGRPRADGPSSGAGSRPDAPTRPNAPDRPTSPDRPDAPDRPVRPDQPAGGPDAPTPKPDAPTPNAPDAPGQVVRQPDAPPVPKTPDAPRQPDIPKGGLDQPSVPGKIPDGTPGPLAKRADDIPSKIPKADAPSPRAPPPDAPSARPDAPDRPKAPDAPVKPTPDAPSKPSTPDAPSKPGVAGKVDNAADAGRAAGKVDNAADAGKAAGKVDNAADAGKVAGKVDDAADAGKVAGKVDNAADAATAAGKADDAAGAAAKVDDVPPAKTPDAATPPKTGPPPPKVFDNTKTLPDAPNKPAAPKQLDDAALADIEKNQGFRKDHAQRMNEFAQEKGAYVLVRDGNPDSVKFFDDPDMMAKPMSSKAKTAKVGPNQGLVVDPTNAKQARYWDDALKKAEAAGDTAKLEKLKDAHKKALDAWKDYGDEMLKVKPDGSHYRVSADGVVEYVDDTGKVFKGIHGDYDLHGVYRKTPDGMEQVSFGAGKTSSGPGGSDIEGAALRQQLNDKLTGGKKEFVRHGGQDDWIPDPDHVPNKPPDPPVTVFSPDGGPPIKLKNADEMKDFYENVMGVEWPYPPQAAKGAAAAADALSDAAKVTDKAADAGRAAGKVADDVPPVRDGPGGTQKLSPDDVPTYRDGPGGRPSPDDTPTLLDGPAKRTDLDDIPTKIDKPGAGQLDTPTYRDGPGSGPRPDAEDVTKGSGLKQPGSAPSSSPVPTQSRAGQAPIKFDPPLTSNGNAKFKTPDGQEVKINTAEKLGGGSSSQAYVNADNPDTVIRVTSLDEVPQAPKLDKAGRNAVEDVQAKLGEKSPIRIVKQEKNFGVVDDMASGLDGQVVEINERMRQGTAKAVMAENNGVMSKGQARAFDEATRALNNDGYAWLDNHSGNYTFEKMPGGGPDDWRVVVMDPGGIVPVKGADAAKAREIQSLVNRPPQDIQNKAEQLKNGILRDAPMAAHRETILEKHGGDIDLQKMGLSDAQEVIFNPRGTLGQPDAQSLFTMTPDEAAKFYGR